MTLATASTPDMRRDCFMALHAPSDTSEKWSSPFGLCVGILVADGMTIALRYLMK